MAGRSGFATGDPREFGMLAVAIHEFAHAQPWLDPEAATAFFQRVVASLPDELFEESDAYLTFGRHYTSGMINILLGNYLLAGIYRAKKGEVTLATADDTAPGITETFRSCPVPVYLSHFPLARLDDAVEWSAWASFRTACELLHTLGTQAKRPATAGRDQKVRLSTLLQ